MDDYIVLEFVRKTGQLMVQFTHYHYTLSIDIPIENGRYIEGDALDRYIRGLAPRWNDVRRDTISRGIENEDAIASLAIGQHVELTNERSRLVRQQRDYLIQKTDWMFTPDSGLSSEYMEKVKIYRQQLRDVPQQPGFPDQIDWPQLTGEYPNHTSENYELYN